MTEAFDRLKDALAERSILRSGGDMYSWLLFTIAFVFVILIPFAPQLVRLRIRIHRWLHWNWSVNLRESHFRGWVLFFRIILFVIAVVVFYIGWTE